MSVWFTGDQHWGHSKMVRSDYSDRPFSTVEEMNEAMVQAWVERVKPGDRVYHLGDVTWGRFEDVVDRLPGQLYLVLGNHDVNRTAKHSRWIWARDAAYIKVEGQKIHLSHYAFETWRSSHHGSWHLHGHSHGNLAPRGRRLDVGVDNLHDGQYAGVPPYAPWAFDEVRLVMDRYRQFRQVDHHRDKVK